MARAGVTAERLTRAAADLADEIGFHNVTVSALARGFGVKPAALYAHVQDAQDLRIRVGGLALTELADRVGEALAGRAGKDALVAFADAYRDYARQFPGRYAAAQLQLDPETVTAATASPGSAVGAAVSPAVGAAVSAARRHAELTRAILRGYGLSEPDQTDAVRMVNSTLHGYVSLETAGQFRHHPREVELSWARTLDALDTVLRHWPPA
ncbi:TetR/AcrR family transcriptional regulator [Nonomuraea sp. 3-1Str]|uniref:TetR/AcrR family transcriptional regulator n=1 Tax=Nonomuraea sp. 3-1Str TaxID=2929801 RepID=UPI00285611EE|nr:TetR/AcrR family transcriptional regulator [Nonomuraea sp. 3-1Str]MDR8414830.1 TetR/AcrR family transcriptional regulator [Nonomuraea sp. 3-1Str]